MEGKEWVWNNGIIVERKVEEMKQEVKKASRRDLEEAKIRVFERFLRNL